MLRLALPLPPRSGARGSRQGTAGLPGLQPETRPAISEVCWATGYVAVQLKPRSPECSRFGDASFAVKRKELEPGPSNPPRLEFNVT